MVESKKQKCRDILEKAMDGITRKTVNPTWFDWDMFNEDMKTAIEELQEAASKQ